jgi:hypothetical protein
VSALAPGALRARLLNRTWRGCGYTMRGEGPPSWLGSADLVANLHELRRSIGGPQALTVAVFRRDRRGLRGERLTELWAVMACGDWKEPAWVEAMLGEEGR